MARSVRRVLDPLPVRSLADHLASGGGQALAAARVIGGGGIVDLVEEAGLRGRGGAGFPTAAKWRTVLDHASGSLPATVAVNAAEGEPGSFKDRTLLLTNPYKVLEGAAVAAIAAGADLVVVATKASFTEVTRRLRQAMGELARHPIAEAGPRFELVEGPDTYLFGEETAMLEVVNGGPSFPRIGPPWRHGIDDDPDAPAAETMATADAGSAAAPVLVNNVETMAHVADILRHGPGWFRQLGLDGQSGTFLCTVTGDTEYHGVVELPVGSTLEDVLRAGGGSIVGEPLGALPGVSHPLVPAESFDVPLAYSGDGVIPVGSGAFRFFSTETDPVAIAAGVARFLAVESCGQYTPCKGDGLEIAERLGRLVRGEGRDADREAVVAGLADHVSTVADGARCALARQHQEIVADVLDRFTSDVAAHSGGMVPAGEPVDIVPLLGIEGSRAVLDRGHRQKQPDWSTGPDWSGQYPVDVDPGRRVDTPVTLR